MSAGWQLSALQMASSVENLIAFALPVLRMDRFAGVIPIMEASSFEDIFLLASITSIFTIIGMSFTLIGFGKCTIIFRFSIIFILFSIIFICLPALPFRPENGIFAKE